MTKKLSLLLLLLASTIILTVVNLYFIPAPSNTAPKTASLLQVFEKPNYRPIIKPSDAYTLIMVGDSMTDFLRPYDREFREMLAVNYPDKVFGIFNYGFGGTNILSVYERLTKETQYLEKTYEPILEREFDVIFIESFGHNPLSKYPLKVGLNIQTNELSRIVRAINKAHPESVIVFVATIAPNAQIYAEGVAELSAEDRARWATERRLYIENHIGFAIQNDIPLINVYELSKNEDGDGDLRYINPSDNIHPSPLGVELINQQISDFIYEQKLLPNPDFED